MNITQKLARWLASREKDYPEGVSIFAGLNINPSQIPFFTTKPGKIHAVLLHRQLENYARIHYIRPAVKPLESLALKKTAVIPAAIPVKTQPVVAKTQPSAAITVFERPLFDTNPVVNIDLLPEGLKQKWFENGRLYAEIKSFHSELKQIQDNPELKTRRAFLSQSIVEREKSITANWSEIDTWWNSRNDVPEVVKTPEEQAVTSALEKQKRIEANLNYIRRYFNSVKPNQIRELEKRKLELNHWNIPYDELLQKVSASAAS